MSFVPLTNLFFTWRQSLSRINKEQAELAILDRFKSAFEKEFGSTLSEIRYRDRPDFEVQDPRTGDKLGIEIAGTYQNTREARIQYWDIDNWGTFTGSTDDLVDSINRVIAKKSEKARDYDFEGRLALVVWLGSLVFNEKIDVDFFRHEISIPENPFADIWLIIRDRNDQSDELYPLQRR